MKNIVVKSFAELGAIMGIKPKVAEEKNKKVCKKCDAIMEKVSGTNVWICHGTIQEKNKDGKVIRERPCGNFAMERSSIVGRTA